MSNMSHTFTYLEQACVCCKCDMVMWKELDVIMSAYIPDIGSDELLTITGGQLCIRVCLQIYTFMINLVVTIS